MASNSERVVYLGPCSPPQIIKSEYVGQIETIQIPSAKRTLEDSPISFIIFGASGDLSRKKLYPTLWSLYRSGLLPPNIRFYGFARSKINTDEVKERSKPHTKISPGDEESYKTFWSLNNYLIGQYSNGTDFKKLNQELSKFENGRAAKRIFYFAVPACVFEIISTNIKNECTSPKSWTRIILEKPFGRDLRSSEALSNHMASLFTEQELYRVDHYLGKEMVQNLMSFRFANTVFSPSWNRHHIACVRITFKEDFGTQGRGGYFDNYGMIRDVMQNHLTQILTLIAMEKPASCAPDDIRDEKVKLLKAINPIDIKDVVLGQYTGNSDKKGGEGYLEDPTVPKDSLTATFALAVLKINNDRWKDVPFILSSGKSLDERKVEVRIQFLDSPEGNIFGGQAKRNELVIRIQPEEAIYVKINLKSPGMSLDLEESEIELTYSSRFGNIKLPDAYERLLSDIFCDSQMNFVRCDELREAWRIFTPLLDYIEKEKVKPSPYVFGSRGPPEVGEMLKINNFVYTGTYEYQKQ